MQEKMRKLVKTLIDSYPGALTGKELAALLKISEKSIQNYIHSLNKEAGLEMITSSNKGYRADYTASVNFLSQTTVASAIPQTFEQRYRWIVKKLLIDKTDEVDAFQLCEDLFISYQTLKIVVKKFNSAYENYNIQIKFKKNKLVVTGNEYDKRKAISGMIYDEGSCSYISFKSLEDQFERELVWGVKVLLEDFYSDWNLYINDFSKMNLLLHILIIIHRIRTNNYVEEEFADIPLQHNPYKSLVEKLDTYLYNSFNIHLIEEEKHNICMQCIINANSCPDDNVELQDYIEVDIADDVVHILKAVEAEYQIDIMDQAFFDRFIMHISLLLHRAKKREYIRNPLAKSVKSNCPFIFEVAVSIAVRLMKKFDNVIKEDEITYIALHIGQQIEKHIAENRKIRTVLLFPEYRDLGAKFYNSLLLEFGDVLLIDKIIRDEMELELLTYDLVITIVELQEITPIKSIVVPPFYYKLNKMLLIEIIDSIIEMKSKKLLMEKFDQYFEAELFVYRSETDKLTMIHQLCERLSQKGYVEDAFEQAVLDREYASSTAFGNIAIPHSQTHNGLKNKVAVAISDRGIMWDNTGKVNIIFLVSIRHEEAFELHAIYESLLKISQDESRNEALVKAKTIEEFKRIILK